MLTSQTPTLARGMAVLTVLAALHVTAAALSPWCTHGPRPPVAVCPTPVQVSREEVGRARLGCATEPALERCGPLQPGDAVQVGPSSLCTRHVQGMMPAWRLLVGLKINLNSATAADLQLLPGVGAKTAATIVAHRQQRGAFKSVQGLRAVRGIGPVKMAKLANYLAVWP